MSLNMSPEVEARIVAKAQEAGVSVDDYLEQLVSGYEEISLAVSKAEASARPLSGEDAQAKIERGLAQLERGEYVDGEQFMAELLSEMDGMERKRRDG